MKRIIVLLFVIMSSLVGVSQTKTDVIDFKKFNSDLLNSLILEECNKIRAQNNLKPFIEDIICGSSAKYQSGYMSTYNILTHDNTKTFDSHFFPDLDDRFNYYYKKLKGDRIYFLVFEVATSRLRVSTSKYPGITTRTYQNYAENIISGFMKSKHHREVLLDYNKDITYGSFKVTYNQSTDNLYVTGVVNPCFIPKKVGK